MSQASQWLLGMNFGRRHKKWNYFWKMISDRKLLSVLQLLSIPTQLLRLRCAYLLARDALVHMFFYIKFSLSDSCLKLKIPLETDTIGGEPESQFHAGSSGSLGRKMHEDLGSFLLSPADPSPALCPNSLSPPVLWLTSMNDRRNEGLEPSGSQHSSSEHCPLGTSIFFLTLGSLHACIRHLDYGTDFSGLRF